METRKALDTVVAFFMGCLATFPVHATFHTTSNSVAVRHAYELANELNRKQWAWRTARQRVRCPTTTRPACGPC
jgi:hypothetical protein